MDQTPENNTARESFVFYRSFYEAIRELPDNIRLEVFTAITEYGLYGRLPENLKPFARGMFTLIKPNLDANNARYENGRKGGRKPRKAPLPYRAGAEAQNPPSDDPSPFTSFEQEVAGLKSEQSWCETISMQFRIDAAELHRRLDAFVLHCKVEKPGELHPSLQDARRHFISWMRKAYPVTERKTKEQSKPDDYTFRGGFGGLD